MLRGSFTLVVLRHLRSPSLRGVRLCSSEVESPYAFNPVGEIPSEEEARERFKYWCKEYNKTYSSEEEKLYRFGIFKETLEWVTRRNNTMPCFGTNFFADLTIEECDRYHGEEPDSDEEEGLKILRSRDSIQFDSSSVSPKLEKDRL